MFLHSVQKTNTSCGATSTSTFLMSYGKSPKDLNNKERTANTTFMTQGNFISALRKKRSYPYCSFTEPLTKSQLSAVSVSRRAIHHFSSATCCPKIPKSLQQGKPWAAATTVFNWLHEETSSRETCRD